MIPLPRQFRLLCLAVGWIPIAWFSAPLHGQGLLEEEGPDSLLPAALGIRTDSQGNSWNVEANGTIGRIGSTMVNSGLALSVNGQKFTGFQPLMTADGKEFVLPGRPDPELPGLQVQRRIRLVDESGILRYAEIFYNGSTDPMRLHVALTTNFSGNYKTFLTDRGRTEPVLLGDGESGILVLPGTTQSTRAYLFTLATPDSAVKPAISAQNRYGLTFQFPVTIEPGETRIVIHHVAQVVIPQEFEPANLLQLFRPRSFAENPASVPDEWRRFLVNASAAGPGGERNDPSRISGIELLGIEPGPRDVLAIGEQTRLYGKAEGGPVSLKGRYGETTLPWEDVAAIAGTYDRESGQPRIFLRDGQVFTAAVDIPGLRFDQTGGGTLDLDIASIDRLVLAESDREPDPAPGVGVIETFHGDRFEIGEASSLRLDGITPWGSLPIALDDLVRLEPASTDQSGYRVEMRDGTRCLVFLRDEEIPVNVKGFGDISLSVNQLNRIFTPGFTPGSTGESYPTATATVVRVAGDQRLVGTIGDSVLPLVSGGVSIETAVSEIRRLEQLASASVSAGGIPEETPSFEIERWDGGIVTGLVTLDALSLEVGEGTWRIPIGDIERIDTPSPELTPEALATIQRLVGDLASDDWATREKATRELGAFGYLARPVLREELASARDPEVNRRLERILAGMN